MAIDGVRPDYPWRRMIAVTVFFLGLIGPAVVMAIRLIFVDENLFGALLLLVLAAWLGHGLRDLWRGRFHAYQTALVLFSLGTAFSLLALAASWASAASGGPRALALPVGALLYFVVGLGTLISVHGDWLHRPGASDEKASCGRARDVQ